MKFLEQSDCEILFLLCVFFYIAGHIVLFVKAVALGFFVCVCNLCLTTIVLSANEKLVVSVYK